ncbi:hypothetical protein BpHYR1_002920 [Brachionus plicatilis]|uniref:RNA-directed DNA polymerase from mobile element jockey-like n=1 Tax=Brachionus plicatilis TaxID=10195 RepID=A0A3M7R2H0_BRAPC|nr:hypothetical protein BpHYR1_002920 [Brachionus plicatilis]
MTSDHFPIEACINFDYSVIPKTQPKKLNYKKANWFLFREILKGQNSGLNSALIDELNEEITQKLISAAHKSIPYQTNRIFKTSLPPNIVCIIKERKLKTLFFLILKLSKFKKKIFDVVHFAENCRVSAELGILLYKFGPINPSWALTFDEKKIVKND